ncbi:unnamed protein product [Symbiodinium pilosum]|uniref:Uncharacterized protein n=1 Tax=Symbiodinium pilosum TaxID=2952 RepID=A0A812S6J8_SYMPI|nr:unnamed protein product [Symbiodinium pilosum]
MQSVPLDILYSSSFDFTRASGFAAALVAVCRGSPSGFLHWMGVLCSSWVTTSRGSTGRSMINPAGCQGLPSVDASNLMAWRVALLCLATSALGGVWVIEQPGSSILIESDPMQMVCGLLQVFKCRFWMWHYQSRTAKPTVLWSPSSAIRTFWRGRLNLAEVRAEKQARNPQNRQAPTRKYKDAGGRQRFQGTSELKGTGKYTFKFGAKIAEEMKTLISRAPRPVFQDADLAEATDIWANWSWDDSSWSSAEMLDVVKYLYGSKDLRIPAKWRPLLPETL